MLRARFAVQSNPVDLSRMSKIVPRGFSVMYPSLPESCNLVLFIPPRHLNPDSRIYPSSLPHPPLSGCEPRMGRTLRIVVTCRRLHTPFIDFDRRAVVGYLLIMSAVSRDSAAAVCTLLGLFFSRYMLFMVRSLWAY